MNPTFTKSQRRRVRELCGLAYERDLSEALGQLEINFRRWRDGEIDAHELSELIHRFHQGLARELFGKYDLSNAEFAVADAIHRGVIPEEEAGAEVLTMLGSHLAFLRDR
jgi:hypothetical protein